MQCPNNKFRRDRHAHQSFSHRLRCVCAKNAKTKRRKQASACLDWIRLLLIIESPFQMCVSIRRWVRERERKIVMVVGESKRRLGFACRNHARETRLESYLRRRGFLTTLAFVKKRTLRRRRENTAGKVARGERRRARLFLFSFWLCGNAAALGCEPRKAIE